MDGGGDANVMKLSADVGFQLLAKRKQQFHLGCFSCRGRTSDLGVVQGLEPFLKEKGEWRSWHVKILAFIMIEFSQGKWLSEEYLREISKKYKTAVWQYQETEEQLNQRSEVIRSQNGEVV